MWLRKKTQNLPTNCASWRLNPHDQPGRLGVYGKYKRSSRAPTKENALVLIAVDIGGKNTRERDQIRIWAAPTAGPEISTVLEGILGRWGGLWLPAKERTLTAVTQEKHVLLLCFDLFCRFFWIFFLFLPPSQLKLSILLALWNLIKLLSFLVSQSHCFIVVLNLCLYVGLLQLCGVFLLFSLFF